MDMRIQRTKKCIQDAFLELRRKKDVEKITVTELADCAMINKATFYNHYTSVFDLSDKMESEAIDSVVGLIEPHEWGTGAGTKRIAVEMKKISDYLTVLFSGSRYGVFAAKLDEKIKEKIYEIYPEHKNDPEKDVILTTMIYGGFYATSKYKGADFERATDIVAKMNDYMIKGLF